MNAEGIREIADMQKTLDAYYIGLHYILIQLNCPDKECIFPEFGDVPEVSCILKEIKKLQQQNRVNEQGKE